MTAIEMPIAYFSRIAEDKDLQVSFQFPNEFGEIDDYCTVVTSLTDTVGKLLSEIVASVTQKCKEIGKGVSIQSGSTKSVIANFYSYDELVPNEYLCLDLPFWMGEEMDLRINNLIYTIILNGPSVDLMKLPRSILTGIPISPAQFKLSYANLDDCDFFWYRKKKDEVAHIANGYCYTPVENDVGCKLMLVCVPKNGDLKGPKYEKTSEHCVVRFPEKFPFEHRHKYTAAPPVRGSFRIISYNILADYCVGSKKHQEEWFPYCEPYALDINYRKPLLNKEIQGYNADIICLQEVDRCMYKDNLEHHLSNRYSGTFWQKSSKVTEGLALFYDKSKFWLKEKHEIILSDELQVNPWLRELWNTLKRRVEELPRFLTTPTSLQAAVLISFEQEEHCLIVANTHLRSWPEPNFFRALQTSIAIRYLECVISKMSKMMPDKKISVIFCGDFNSNPDSCVYELMTKQRIKSNHPCWSEAENTTMKGVKLSHTLKLGSAYGKPKFTNYTHDFCGCLDYIFYQLDALQVLQIVPLPSEEEVTENTAIPSPLFPSDHLALVADLSWM